MSKRKSFAVWMLKDVASTLSEIKEEVLPNVQEVTVLEGTPTQSVPTQNNPNSQGIAPKPVQSTSRILKGGRLDNWRDRLKNRQILSQPVKKEVRQKASREPARTTSQPKQNLHNPTTGTHRFCLKCKKKYLLDTKFRKCVDCGGQISLQDVEQRILDESTLKASRIGGNVSMEFSAGDPRYKETKSGGDISL